MTVDLPDADMPVSNTLHFGIIRIGPRSEWRCAGSSETRERAVRSPLGGPLDPTRLAGPRDPGLPPALARARRGGGRRRVPRGRDHLARGPSARWRAAGAPA